MGKKKVKELSTPEYEIIDNGPECFHHVLLTDESPYPGILFQFGKVELIEEDDALRIKFKYEVFENPNNFKHEHNSTFVDYIGEILFTNLHEILVYNEYQKAINEF